MSRINSNIPSLIARSNLGKANNSLSTSLERLSTGVRINRGKDDPAGLIISNRLGNEINGLQQAIKNSERAGSVISTAEASLSEVNDLLNSVKALLVEAANTGAISDEERRANQLQVDSAIESITRISSSASFGGLKLLNGSLDYVLSGLNTADVNKATIHSANLTGKTSLQVDVQTVASAQTGRLYVRGDYSGGLGNGVFQSSTTLEIAGPKGVQVIEVLSGRPLSSVVAAVNQFKDVTGVSAALNNGSSNSGMVFSSIGFGTSEFVSVKRLGGPATGGFFQTYRLADGQAVPPGLNIATAIGTTLIPANRDDGRDVFAVVNGALGTGRGLSISLPSTTLSLELLLGQTFATTNGSTTSFHITGGGALYQLGGDINSSQQVFLSLPSIAASRLGGTLVGSSMQFLDSIRSGGANDFNTKRFAEASSIVQTSIDEISVLRGRLGALERNTLETNQRAVSTAIENLTSSQSLIRDADFAAETSALTRSQVLSSAATSALQLANSQSQNVLQLLRS